MADFKTHISVSSTLGVAYGVGGYFVFDISIPHCTVAGALCSVAGMLPDLDSNSSIPQREMLSFVSVIVPMLMIRRFEAFELTPEYMVFVAGLMYAIIRFGIGGIFRHFTRHRGMWHSMPAALIAGLATFLVCLSPELGVRVFKGWAVVLGFISHLVLDEIYAVDWKGETIRVKKSFGTALKWIGTNWWWNVSTYGKLAFLVVLVLSDQSLMDYFGAKPLNVPFSARDWFIDSIGSGNPIIFR